ncbi:ABC transporter permease [Arthrobacter sp. GMC3]|uniref:ABC transporter permease n=1 Tax=Arthrobacter sp. GMC3 TaxID=2058894 RepID=UPI002157842E|nr:ABC transporter permease [Arthrobacter sp. GMC3]
MPGDPGTQLLLKIQQTTGIAPSEETVKNVRALFGGDDQNLAAQYLTYLGQIFQGNLGVSTSQYPTPVSELVFAALPWTVLLVGISTVLAFAIGVTIGISLGWKAGGRADSFFTPAAAILGSIPYFWVAVLAVWFFAIILGWFPIAGGYDPSIVPGFSLLYVLGILKFGFLPAATIIFSTFGGWVIGQRNMMVTTLGEDYILLAKAKGLSPRRIMFRYAARNAILPSFTGLALSIAGIVAGALLTEVVFGYPGMGSLLFRAVTERDYPVMQAVFLLTTFAVLIANFIADSTYALLDPRTREDG